MAGFANYTAQTFPSTRVLLTPLSRWLGHVARCAKGKKDLWAIIKNKEIIVPSILLDMLRDGYKHARDLRWTHVTVFLAGPEDADAFSSTDACALAINKEGIVKHPPGIGIQDHDSGGTLSLFLDASHIFYKSEIIKLEAYATLLELDRRTLHRINYKGADFFVLVSYQDNEGVKWGWNSYKPCAIISDIFYFIGQICINRKVIFKMVRADTKVIVADPLSRGDINDWHKRRNQWTLQKIPFSEEILSVRDDYWQRKLVKIQQKY